MNDDLINNDPVHTPMTDQPAEKPTPVGGPFHLAGMTLAQAHDYVIQHMATAERLKQELDECRKGTSLWQERVKLAQDKGRHDLSLQAEARVKELSEKGNILELDLWVLTQEIPALKQELARMAAFTPSVDASHLLEQMEHILGKEKIVQDKIDTEIEARTIEDELSLLKAQLQKNKNR